LLQLNVVAVIGCVGSGVGYIHVSALVKPIWERVVLCRTWRRVV